MPASPTRKVGTRADLKFEDTGAELVILPRTGSVSHRNWPTFDDPEEFIGWLTRLPFQDHIVYDVDMWDATLRQDDGRGTILKKVFTLLRWGRLQFSPSGSGASWGDGTWHDWVFPICTALSHGSRIIIVLPPKASTEFDLWDWISHGYPIGGGILFDRGKFGFSGSTHAVAIDKNQQNTKEVKFQPNPFKKAFNLSAVFTGYNFGMNLPLGGNGRQGPVGKGTLVDCSGRHGTMLFQYQPPTWDKNGSLQIGVEASGPGMPDQFGSGHGHGAEQNGTGVSLYWHTSGKVKGMDRTPGCPALIPAKYDGMRILNVRELSFYEGMFKQWSDNWIQQRSVP